MTLCVVSMVTYHASFRRLHIISTFACCVWAPLSGVQHILSSQEDNWAQPRAHVEQAGSRNAAPSLCCQTTVRIAGTPTSAVQICMLVSLSQTEPCHSKLLARRSISNGQALSLLSRGISPHQTTLPVHFIFSFSGVQIKEIWWSYIVNYSDVFWSRVGNLF